MRTTSIQHTLHAMQANIRQNINNAACVRARDFHHHHRLRLNGALAADAERRGVRDGEWAEGVARGAARFPADDGNARELKFGILLARAEGRTHTHTTASQPADGAR